MPIRPLDNEQKQALFDATLRLCYPAYAAAHRDAIPDWVLRDLDNYVDGRTTDFRAKYVPWFERHVRLDDARVLEIGAGTGSSAVVLAERGARVDGIDIDTGALEIAKMRARFHGYSNVTFRPLNATAIDQLKRPYNLIVFFASLEHMTWAERKVALAKAWALLAPDGFLSIVDCPNRLWFMDHHTSLANFFQWLPDELAMDYAALLSRPVLRDAFKDGIRDAAAGERLARWGRAASFHELELVLGPVESLDVREGLEECRQEVDAGTREWWATSAEGRYRDLLASFEPRVQGAFFYPGLDVLIRRTVDPDAAHRSRSVSMGAAGSPPPSAKNGTPSSRHLAHDAARLAIAALSQAVAEHTPRLIGERVTALGGGVARAIHRIRHPSRPRADS